MLKEISNRRSIREYSSQKVEKEKIELIIRASMQAPSARGQQPWLYYVEENKDVLLEVSKNFTNISFAKDASFVLVYLTDKTNLKTEAMYPQDLASAITLSLIEAQSLGIGSCWCGIYPRQERMQLVRDIFDLHDEKYEPFALVTFGYPLKEDAFKFVDRFDEKKILKW